MNSDSLKNINKEHWPLLILFGGALLFCLPIFNNITFLGAWDWDQHFFYHAAPLKSIKEYFQFPQWNPYYCGGHALSENPQSRFLAPFFILHLILGPVIALKLELLLHYMASCLGFYLIGKNQFKIESPWLLLLTPLLFTFSGFHVAHFSAGHSTFFASMWAPLSYYFFQKAILKGRPIDGIFSGLIIAIMILEGGVFSVSYFTFYLFLYCLLSFAIKKSWHYWRVLFIAGVSSFLFSAIKFIPMWLFLGDHSRKTGGNETTPLSQLYEIFFKNEFSPEWSSYMGYFSILLLLGAIISFGKTFRSNKYSGIHLALGLFFFLFALGDHGELTPYKFLHHLPVINQLHKPLRALPYSFFGFGIFFLSFLRTLDLSKVKWMKIAVAIIGLGFFIDLTFYAHKHYKKTFHIDPKKSQAITDKFKSEKFGHIIDAPRYFSGHAQFSVLQANKGLLKCYEILPIQGGIYEKMQSQEQIVSEKGSVSNIKFTPNKITFDLKHEGGDIILNQNFAKGWNFSLSGKRVFRKRGRAAVYLEKGEYRNLSFYYQPKSFYFATLLTLIGFILAFLIWRKKWNI